MLIFGMLQFGLAFFQLQNLRAATREGARLAAVGAPLNDVRTKVNQASLNSIPGNNGAIAYQLCPATPAPSDSARVTINLSSNQLPGSAAGHLQRRHPLRPDDQHHVAGLRRVPVRILTSRFARAKGEEGATAVIVVLCIIAMFGMIVLVMDVGGLLLRRRSMVNGADAAALAAAKSCVLAPSVDPRTPEQAADEWAADNVNGVNTGPTNILQIANCDGGTSAPNGYVSVRYQAPQDLFFAPVLGYPDTGTVTTDATAIWGPPGSANPIPIVIYNSSFNNCQLDTDPTPGSRCYVWEDNGNTTGAQSAFGLLDLRTDDPSRYGWDSVPGAQCSDTGSGPNDWIGDYPSPDIGDLPSNYPAPTYVCRSNGFQQSAWALLEQLEGQDPVLPREPLLRHTGRQRDGRADQLERAARGVRGDPAPVRHHRVRRLPTDRRPPAPAGTTRHGELRPVHPCVPRIVAAEPRHGG